MWENDEELPSKLVVRPKSRAWPDLLTLERISISSQIFTVQLALANSLWTRAHHSDRCIQVRFLTFLGFDSIREYRHLAYRQSHHILSMYRCVGLVRSIFSLEWYGTVQPPPIMRLLQGPSPALQSTVRPLGELAAQTLPPSNVGW